MDAHELTNRAQLWCECDTSCVCVVVSRWQFVFTYVFTGALSAAARHEFRLVIVDLQHVAMHKRDEQLAGLLCPQLDDVIAQSARDPEAPPGISPRISCLEQAHRFPEMRESRHLAIRIRQGLGSIEARIGLHVTQADAEIP
jgi:hypothetical protein